MRILKDAVALGGALSVASSPAHAAWTLNLRTGVTELSRDIYDLHMLILVVCVVIAVAVFSVMIYSIATFRKSKGAVPAKFDHSTTAEIVWTNTENGIHYEHLNLGEATGLLPDGRASFWRNTNRTGTGNCFSGITATGLPTCGTATSTTSAPKD